MNDDVSIGDFTALALGMLSECELSDERSPEQKFRRMQEFVIAATAIQVIAIVSLRTMSPKPFDIEELHAKAVEYARFVLQSAKTRTTSPV